MDASVKKLNSFVRSIDIMIKNNEFTSSTAKQKIKQLSANIAFQEGVLSAQFRDNGHDILSFAVLDLLDTISNLSSRVDRMSTVEANKQRAFYFDSLRALASLLTWQSTYLTVSTAHRKM